MTNRPADFLYFVMFSEFLIFTGPAVTVTCWSQKTGSRVTRVLSAQFAGTMLSLSPLCAITKWREGKVVPQMYN